VNAVPSESSTAQRYKTSFNGAPEVNNNSEARAQPAYDSTATSPLGVNNTFVSKEETV